MYILFGGECYYAKGGGNDFLGSFHTLEGAERVAKEIYHDGFTGPFGDDPEDYCHDYYSSPEIEWWHVFCTETMQIVARSEVTPHGNY